MKDRYVLARVAVFLLSAVLLLSSCGGGTSAATMHLVRTEGTVGVSDGDGRDIDPMDNLGLYSGYQVGTQAESYAWINLDDVKLTKMDAESQVEIAKDGGKLEINVKSGSLFFNVIEPLADDESMDIRTSSMMVGIRGTCGWVTEDTAALLEGTVTVTAEDQSATVNAGEMAVLTDEGTLEVKPLTASSVPAFVQDEIANDEDLVAAVQETAEMDLAEADPMDGYADLLAQIEKEGKILYTEIIDFEQDGNPELLVIYENGLNEATDTNFIAVTFYRNGPEGISWLCSGRRPWNKEEWEIDKFSLVEYGGRLYLEEHRQSHGQAHHGEAWGYHFSSAEKDGAKESWHWMYISSSNSPIDGIKYYGYGNTEGDEIGPDEISAEEYEAIRGQFNEVRVLVCLYTPDGKNVTVTSDPSEIEEIQSIETEESVEEP